MRIAILVEGKTENAFKPHLISFLRTLLAGKMPKLDFVPYDGRIVAVHVLIFHFWAKSVMELA